MSEPMNETAAVELAPATTEESAVARRALLKKIGRYAAVTAPAVTLLMAAGSKPAAAATSIPVESSRQLKISEGPVDDIVLSSALAHIGDKVAIGTIDGIGICLGAIKALNARLDMLAGELRPALL